jgi:hypothetical protein
MTENAPQPEPEKKTAETWKPEDLNFRELIKALPSIVPPVATAYRENAKEDTERHKLTMRYWMLPFFAVIGIVSIGVFFLATRALDAGKDQFAQTVIGYFLTYLGGIGTGQLIRTRGKA